MKRKLLALAFLAALVFLSIDQLQKRTDLLSSAKGRLFSRILQGGLLAAAAVLAFPFVAFWPAVAIATGILVATGALGAIGKALSPSCPPGMVQDDDSPTCLGIL